MTTQTPSLTDLLQRAREQYPNRPELAPGVSDVEAHVAAWHAVAVQRGFSSPVREAWRLSVDRGLTDRHIADDTAWLDSQEQRAGNPTVDYTLVSTVLKPSELAAALAPAAPPVQPAQPGQFLEAGQRGEWTAPDGKAYHTVPVTHPSYGEGTADHVGTWLTCDACNPVQVLDAVTYPDRWVDVKDLRAEYAEAKQAAEAAAERFSAAKAKIRTALSEATNGALRSALHVPGFKPLTLTYGERWTVDAKALKAEQPLTYVQYARLGSSWTVAESKGERS